MRRSCFPAATKWPTMMVFLLAMHVASPAWTSSSFPVPNFSDAATGRNISMVASIRFHHEHEISNSTTFVSDPLNIMGRLGALLVVLMIVLGSTGNLMVLVVIVKFPRLKKSYNTFIASLSATDLLFNILIMPFFADSYLHRNWRFGMKFCRFHAFFGTTLVMCSSLHVALIALNRYFLVVHASWYPKVSRTRVQVFQIFLVWIISISSVIPGVLGWKAVVQYTDQIGRCTYVRSESKESLDIVFVLGFVLPCIIVFFCYTLIWMKSRRSKNRMRSYGSSSHDRHHHHNHHHHHHLHHYQQNHNRIQNQEMSFLEWLSSKMESNHHHLGDIGNLRSFPMRRAWWNNYFFHFRHSLPSALEETKFDEQSTIPLARNGNRIETQDAPPAVSVDVANKSPKKVIFTCGEEEPQIETPILKLESVVENMKPVVNRGTALAMRVIKSYVRKQSENDLLKPIKSCLSCPDFYDLKRPRFIIPMLVISPDSGNLNDCWGRKVDSVISENQTSHSRGENSLEGHESPDLSILNKNHDCFGCLKIKKDVKTETSQCPCKVRFALLETEGQNDSSSFNDNLNEPSQEIAKKDSTEEIRGTGEIEIVRLGSQTGNERSLTFENSPKMGNSVLSKNNLKISHPSGCKVSDISSNMLPPISILSNEMSFSHSPERQKQSSCSLKKDHYLKRHPRRRHSTKIILTIFFAFVFTYLPFTVVNLADDKGELSRNWYMITSLGFWAGSCLNPYIYGAMNDQFRSAYCSILSSLFNFICGRQKLSLSVGK